MTQQAAGYEDSDIPLASGRLRVRRWGAADAPAVVCVPGLSANLCSFDRLAEWLVGDALQLVAIDLRGRGRSEVTGPGSYGWRHRTRSLTNGNAPDSRGGTCDKAVIPPPARRSGLRRRWHRRDSRVSRRSP